MKKLKDINWNQVYCFYEVAKKLSMKEAGKVLRVSIPTISEQIRRLEKELEMTLFKRRPRKIELTSDGATLYGFAKEMFEVGGRLVDAISPTSIGGYTVRVGVSDMVSTSEAVDFLNRYAEIYAPYGFVSTRRESQHDNLLEKLHQGQYDWIISLAPINNQKLNSSLIANLEVVYCSSHQVFNRYKNKEDILRNIPLARSSWDTALNTIVQEDLNNNNVSPEETIETDHVEFALTLASRGRCVVPLMKNMIKSLPAGTDLKEFYLKEPMGISMNAVWQKSFEKMNSVQKLFELLRN